MPPLAYHITWHTYGTWLPGDEHGWVQQGNFGIQDPSPIRKDLARQSMSDEPVILSQAQRSLVDATIRRHCEIRGWTIHALNVRTTHVHIVVTAGRDPETVMEQFKAWCSRRLSEQAGLKATVKSKNGLKKWWTKHGSTKWINDEEYLRQAIHYVLELQ